MRQSSPWGSPTLILLWPTLSRGAHSEATVGLQHVCSHSRCGLRPHLGPTVQCPDVPHISCIRLDTQAPWCSKHVPHISRYYWGSQWAVHLSHGTLLTSTGVECDLETPRAKEKSNFQLLPNSKGVTTASATTYLIWQVFTTDAFVYSMEPFTDTHKGNVV